MSKLSSVDHIHQRALAAAGDYHNASVNLLDALSECDLHRIYFGFGYRSLFEYAVVELNLSEDVAYNYITVSRKCAELPQLRNSFSDRRMNISKARRLCAVIDEENFEYWLELALTVSKRTLEKLIAEECPQDPMAEQVVYIDGETVALDITFSEAIMLALRRAQEVLIQKRRRNVDLAEVIEVLVTEYLRRHDPLKRARRQQARGKLLNPLTQDRQKLVPGRVGWAEASSNVISEEDASSKDDYDDVEEAAEFHEWSDVPEPFDIRSALPPKERTKLPAEVRHLVMLNYEGQCAFIDEHGHRCSERHLLDVHHIVPLSEGGSNDLSNLELLCQAHHKLKHNRH